MSRGPAYFVIRLYAFGMPPELAARHARQCEQILRERAPAGIEVDTVQLHASGMSPGAKAYSKNARAALKRLAERDHQDRLRQYEREEREAEREQQRLLAERAGEEVEWL